jgi:hypothetical protein
METKLPKDITDKLAIKDLKQVFDKDLANEEFAFLGLGKLSISYNCKVVHGDDFAARLAGCDHPYQIERKGVSSSHITIPLPKDSTHYYLGEMDSDEELYVNHKENSFSRDFASIIFLKKINA